MELAEIRPFEPQMAEIDLFTMPDAVGVGEPSVRKVKPYIKGHVTDGSSTFTFKVNNTDITVPVDANGNWKWVVDRDITRLYRTFYETLNIDYVEIYLPNNPYLNDINEMCLVTSTVPTEQMGTLEIFIKSLDTINCTSFYRAFQSALIGNVNLDKFTSTKKVQNYGGAFLSTYVSTIDVSNISVDSVKAPSSAYSSINALATWSQTETIHLGDFLSNPITEGANIFGGTNGKLKNITARTIKISVNFSSMPILTAQSVVNIINAVAADSVTLTFHATVYAMIQAQLDIEDSPIYNAYWNSDYDFTIISA